MFSAQLVVVGVCLTSINSLRAFSGVNTSITSVSGSTTFNPRGLFVPFRLNSQLRFHYSDEDSLFGFTCEFFLTILYM